METSFNAALCCHQQGLLEDAARLYRQVLDSNPAHSNALLLLGLVAMQQGSPTRGVELISRAVALDPEVALYHANLGEAYRMLGHYEKAADSFRRALALDPHLAPVANNLGLCLETLGETEGAAAAFRTALRLQPDLALGHNNLAMALYRLGDKAGAMEHFRRAVAAAPAMAEAQSNLGQLLLEIGRPEEALVHCREAVRLGPEMAEARLNLGRVLRELEHPAEAEALYVDALRLRPGMAIAWNDLGLLAHEQAKLPESLQRYDKCLSLDPSFAPAHCNRGVVLAEQGDLVAAERAFRAALGHGSSQAEAYFQLATVLGGVLPESDVAAMSQLLGTATLSSDERSTLHSALCLVLDARGDFEAAADHAQQANALCLSDWRARGRAYDAGEHERLIDGLITACPPAFFERLRGFGSETERPIFIVGLPRSGTTLTEQILASHSQVHGGGELRLIPELFESLPRVMGACATPAECLDRLDRATIGRLAQELDDQLRARAPRALRVVDKMPENYLYLGLLAALFPRARFIHCQRDLRDVAVSCWMTHFRKVRWASDPEHIASRIRAYRRIMDAWRRALPFAWLDVGYEETVADTESAARRLVAWCGLDWEPACLAFHQSRRVVRSASLAQVRKPVYGHAVGRWKHYQHALGPLFAELAALIQDADFHRGGLDAQDIMS
jgi:tetratricopeptide (TPR) repeat protein